MATLSADDHHKLIHPSHQMHLLKKSLRQIDIPPRKHQHILSRGGGASSSPPGVFLDSPHSFLLLHHHQLEEGEGDDEEEDEDDADPYSSDHFRMYEFKVRKCTRSRSHDWTDCPFAHPGEKARRRDPRRFHYSGFVCPEFRRGGCSRGENCEFSHGLFECWLHPSRYRTEACKDGKNCKRKVCFFAHTPRQLRIVPVTGDTALPEKKSPSRHNTGRCCAFCHSFSAASPTSTLVGGGMSHFSPPLSPTHSPEMVRFSYEDAAIAQLLTSLEAMTVKKAASSPKVVSHNLPWLEVNFNGDDHHQQQQFVLSPSTPSSSSPLSLSSPLSSRIFPSTNNSKSLWEDTKYSIETGLNGLNGPDLGWVNDLLT